MINQLLGILQPVPLTLLVAVGPILLVLAMVILYYKKGKSVLQGAVIGLALGVTPFLLSLLMSFSSGGSDSVIRLMAGIWDLMMISHFTRAVMYKVRQPKHPVPITLPMPLPPGTRD